MELLDIYDDKGNKTGRTVIRGDKTEKLSPHEHIAVAVIFIENDQGEYLIQKTSKEKGGEYSSTGGHIDHNETPLSTIQREVKEELGINIENEVLEEYGFISYNMPLFYLFYWKKNIDIEEIKVQKEEVDYVTYLSKQEIEDLIKNGEMLPSHGFLFQKLQSKKTKNYQRIKRQ